ncbi:MAG: hypothetical protein RLZZ579_84, partial [Actinomycetota bacterium]
SSPAQPFRASGAAFRARGRFEDLLLHGLDLMLFILTLGIGAVVWSFVAAIAGQTPAGKLRDQVLVNVKNSIQAPAWKLIIRQLVTYLILGFIVVTLVNGFDILIDVGGYYFSTYVIPGIVFGFILLDTALLLTPMRRRLIDWILAIRWTDGNGHSFRNYKPQGVL